MAGIGEMGDMNETLRSVADQAREAWERFSEEVELDRRLRENPMAVLGVAAAAGFVLGGGLWPVLRPFVRAATRAALSPTNLLAIGAAVGAMRAAGQREESAAAGPAGPVETH
jgi:preprotein translocase subunit Sec61beta